MNRIALAAFALACISAPAFAADVKVTVSDADQKNWALIPNLFDQCITAAALHGEVKGCRVIGDFIMGFSGAVANAPAVPPPEPAPKDAPAVPPVSPPTP